MGKKVVFSLFDSVAEMYGRPMFASNVAVMYRELQDEVRRGGDNNPLATHPGDYQLKEIGVFDEATGELVPCKPRLVVVCSELVKDVPESVA